MAGIIPARAGSRSRQKPGNCSSRDHPRACGEQPLTASFRSPRPGSSPRVRGAVVVDYPTFKRVEIIPARAGSSPSEQRRTRAVRDHPRACGEQFAQHLAETGQSGSSPRVRGAAAKRGRGVLFIGIIPARAGSSRRWPCCPSSARDHPRACGEQSHRDTQ